MSRQFFHDSYAGNSIAGRGNCSSAMQAGAYCEIEGMGLFSISARTKRTGGEP